MKTSTLLPSCPPFTAGFYSVPSWGGWGAPPCLTLGHGHISSYSPGGVSPTPTFHEHFLPFGSSSPQNPHLSDSAFLWQGPPPLSSSYWGHLIPRARGRAPRARESAICIYWPSHLTSGSMSGTIRVFLIKTDNSNYENVEVSELCEGIKYWLVKCEENKNGYKRGNSKVHTWESQR